MMGQPVKQGGGQFFIPKDLHPFRKGQIGGHDSRAAFITIGHQVEEQLAAVALEGHEPEFVDDQYRHLLQATVKPAEGTVVACLHQIPDQIGGLVESHSNAPAGCLHAKRNRQMGLAGTDGSGDDHVMRLLHESAACKLMDHGAADALEQFPVDLVKGLDVREVRLA